MVDKWEQHNRLGEPVCVRLTEQQREDLQRICHRYGFPISQAVRDLIDFGLSEYKKNTI